MKTTKKSLNLAHKAADVIADHKKNERINTSELKQLLLKEKVVSNKEEFREVILHLIWIKKIDIADIDTDLGITEVCLTAEEWKKRIES